MNYESAIIQNLKDAGCAPEFIQNFMSAWKADKKCEGLKLLTAYRCSLLEALHQDQKRIDCLDYLVYQIKKSEKE